MRKLTLVCLALTLVAATAMASGVSRIDGYNVADGRYDNVFTSTGTNSAKSDTVYLLGGPGAGTGKFHNDINPTLPDWEGWTSVDLTEKTTEIWHIDTFNAPAGGNAIWCGEVFASCGAGDPAEGYGNGYEEYLDWVGTVADNGLPTNVTVVFDINYDNEPGYDYLYLTHNGAAGYTVVGTYNGSTWDSGTSMFVPLLGETVSFTVAAADLVGAGSNEVHLRFRGTSDGGWSDSDCLWPTSGLAQLDNISVSGDNGLPGTTDDFESGMLASNWFLAFPVSVGDFAKIWPQLAMLDPCNTNDTPQVAFIDDGVVVPCTGGTLGTTWTYGPGSYTHNLTGGCAGPTYHAQNEVWSPVLAWEDELGNPIGSTHAGANYTFEVYRHLPLLNGMFYVWHLRSSNDNGVTWTGWADRNFVYYSNTPGILRVGQNVTDLVTNTPTNVQLALGVYELGWIWGLSDTDGTPAPYFDNVAFTAYAIQGPAITTRELEMAQDNFPTIGDIDLVDLSANDIRFDMANDIMGDVAAAILPGDSITYDVTAVRPGSALNSRPRLYYTMKANSLFDPYRLHATSGFVEGDTVFTATGVVVPDRYGFDLPDEDFFFPGDVIHYYIWAEDNQAGDIGVTTLPGDLSGYGVFPGDAGYVSFDWPSSNIVRGLPTISDAAGTQPEILFYNDFGGRGGENEWVGSLNNLGYIEGVDYDVYYVNAPSSGVSNGLGSRATALQIAGYNSVLYTFGNLSSFSLPTFDQASDKTDDLSLFDTWLQTGKNMLLTGDNIAYDLTQGQGTAGLNFVNTWLSVNYVQHDVSALLGGVTAPLVQATTGNATFDLGIDFIAYGSCPGLNTFDAVQPAGTTEVIANWAGHAGLEAAGFSNVNMGSKVVYFPVDLMYWYTTPGYTPPGALGAVAARTEGLNNILIYFGHLSGSGTPTGVGDAPRVLSARNFPNPFNPTTEIKFNMPKRGHVNIEIFNVRGELVRTLVDEVRDAGLQSVMWNGTSDSGSDVASGVYFYQTKTDGQTVVNKMALVK